MTNNIDLIESVTDFTDRMQRGLLALTAKAVNMPSERLSDKIATMEDAFGVWNDMVKVREADGTIFHDFFVYIADEKATLAYEDEGKNNAYSLILDYLRTYV